MEIGPTVLASAVNTLTAFAISEEYPPDAFHLTFPQGTIVFDKRTKEQYTIGKNDSRTNILTCSSPESLKIFETLDSPVDFSIEPQAFRDALDFIKQRYQIAVRIDEQAFRQAGIDLRTEVRASAPGAPLRDVLQTLLWQLDGPVGFEVRDGALVVASFVPRPAKQTAPAGRTK
jgi:hypothetical protein